MTRVFLSYALPDKGFAQKLARALSAHGVDAFDPNNDLRPGEDISTSLISRLKRADMLVFVVPRFEGQGKGALVELGAAKALGKRIIAVLPDKMRLSNSNLASVLGSTYLFDATEGELNTLVERLLSDTAAA